MIGFAIHSMSFDYFLLAYLLVFIYLVFFVVLPFLISIPTPFDLSNKTVSLYFGRIIEL